MTLGPSIDDIVWGLSIKDVGPSINDVQLESKCLIQALLRKSIIYISTYSIIENFASKIFNYKISMYVYDRFEQ